MTDPNTLALADLWETLERDRRVEALLRLARDEDLGDAGDLTAIAMRSATRVARADVRAREPMTVSGLAAIPLLTRVFGTTVRVAGGVADGGRAGAGQTLATLEGDLAQIVALERTLLHLVGRLSGVATLTSRYVDAVAGTRARILDTRKTTPGMRLFEKYAVRCGGGSSHRLGLYDAVLVKDNHIAPIALDDLAGELARASREIRAARSVLFFEVEVDTLAQLERVLSVEAGLIDIVLLDNMAPETLREAVRLRDARAPGVLLEASGGVRLDTVRAIAETGVDRISVGGLTHSAVSVDVGLDIR